MKKMKRALVMGCLGAVCLTAAGCAGFRASVETVDVNEARHYNQNYDYSDLRRVSSEITEAILNSRVFSDGEEKPVVIFGGIRNSTSEYLDTDNLSDKMRTALFKSGQVRLVNERSREKLADELAYQSTQARAETRVKAASQYGARYIITGTITCMRSQSAKQVRISKRETSYYKLTAEITDLETGLLAWTDDTEFAREVNVPLVRW
jgi:uncharacterized protein (TIGR02722 family)